MPEHTLTVGAVLLGVIPLIAWDAVATLRDGFDSAFWARPLGQKLNQIEAHPKTWERIGIVWIAFNLITAAGFTAFAFQLAATGEGVWAGLGLGAYLLSAIAFLPGVVLMVATVRTGADTGTSETWVLPAWRSTWWLERSFIIGANLAYVAWGVGILRSGFPADWAGWVAIATGALVAAWASTREYFFQHMTLITPIAIGVALVLY